MTKKGKLILGWSIPALTVTVVAGAALPTIIFLDSEKREILNSIKLGPEDLKDNDKSDGSLDW